MKKNVFGLLLVIVFLIFLKQQPPSTPSSSNNLPALEPTTERQRETTPQVNREDSLRLGPLNHSRLLTLAAHTKQSGRFRFAEAREVQVSPNSHGQWQRENGNSTWQMTVESRGAVSLNFGFTDYVMPPGGTLTISDAHGDFEGFTFTEADNDEHGELWTPILKSDRVVMNLTVPTSQENQLALTLAKVNHGFRDANPLKEKIGNTSSGSCNIDVVCSAADDSEFGPLIDLYRDQIRSVAAYTLNGQDTCSGALINNTRNDRRPFFLTANHCQVTSANARTMVLFWNFQNSTCRRPGSRASGSNGNGPISQFNSGAIFLASSAASDFCLVELDDPISPLVEPYYAGWDRRNITSDSSIAIHHPGVSEKRISFDLNPSVITTYLNPDPLNNGTHLQIRDWDFGTTEGGSSGSPLFNEAGQIIGQLHGGFAACGNQSADWYGRIYRSWTGDGSSRSRLSNWLDPDGTGAMTLDGINGVVTANLTAMSGPEGDGDNRTIPITITLREAASLETSINIQAVSESAMVESDFLALDQRVTFPAGILTQTVQLTIITDEVPEENETFQLILSDGDGISAGTQGSLQFTIFNDDFIPPVITNDELVTTTSQTPLNVQITANNTPTSYRLENAPDGMTINENTGLVSWFPDMQGIYTADLVALNPAGEGRLTITVSVLANRLVFALDLGATTPLFKGTPGFEEQIAITHDGVDAAQSESITHGQEASFSITVTGPEVIKFWWKVDSEPLADFLSVKVDGVEERRISGDLNWQQPTIVIPEGTHEVSWSYRKDGANSSGRDRAWVDEVELATITGEPAITSELRATAIVARQFSYTLESVDPEARFFANDLPDGLNFDGDRTISGMVMTQGQNNVSIGAFNQAGDLSETTLLLTSLEDISDDLDTQGVNWNIEGDGFWLGQNSVSFDGSDAITTSRIGHSQFTQVTTTITGPDEVAFWWKVDSEEHFDTLTFKIDGIIQKEISGNQDWRRTTVVIPAGQHKLAWEYAKDDSISIGQDTGWVDQISFVSERLPFFRTQDSYFAIREQAFRLPLEIINAVDTISFENLPNWLSWNEETRELTGMPTQRGINRFTVRASNAGGENELPIVIQVMNQINQFGDAMDQSELAFFDPSNSGGWRITNSAGQEGGTILSSNNIRDNGFATLSVLVQGPGRVTFDWTVSSEEGRDFFDLRVDDALIDSISGSQPWLTRSLELTPGLHEVSWIFRRDGSGGGGVNRASLDNLRLDGYARFLTERGISHSGSLSSDDTDGDGYDLFQEYAFGGDVDDPRTPSLLSINRLTAPALNLSFRGRRDPFDIDYYLEKSPSLDLSSWSTIEEGISFFETDMSDYGDYRFTLEPLVEPKAFYRIEAAARR